MSWDVTGKFKGRRYSSNFYEYETAYKVFKVNKFNSLWQRNADGTRTLIMKKEKSNESNASN